MEVASRTPCPAAFGSKIHPSHALSVGVARTTGGDEGVPLAMCRRCGCYASHATVRLSGQCDGGVSSRKSKIRRFMRGLHPERCKEGVRIECVKHYGVGRFAPVARCSAPPVGEAAVTGAAAAHENQGYDVFDGPAGQPSIDEVMSELHAWEEEAAAACLVDRGQDDDEDVFGHMVGDIFSEGGSDAAGPTPPSVPEAPCPPLYRIPHSPACLEAPPKRRKIRGKQPAAEG